MNRSNTATQTVQVGRLTVTTHRAPAVGELYVKRCAAPCLRIR